MTTIQISGKKYKYRELPHGTFIFVLIHYFHPTDVGELKECIHDRKHNKAPGLDGITSNAN